MRQSRKIETITVRYARNGLMRAREFNSSRLADDFVDDLTIEARLGRAAKRITKTTTVEVLVE